MKNMGQIMKQAQEMQAKMAAMQESLEHMIVDGHAGGSLVTVSMNGKGHMKKIVLDPSLVKEEEIEMLEDLIVAACNDARTKIDNRSAEEMAKVTGGLKLPAGMQLPF